MKLISPRIHGYLDFLTVILFLLAPALFGLNQLPALLAYSLAGIHLVVTLTSDFPFGIVKIIPFPIHGWIERIVGPTLVAVPFILGFADDEVARPQERRQRQSRVGRIDREPGSTQCEPHGGFLVGGSMRRTRPAARPRTAGSARAR